MITPHSRGRPPTEDAARFIVCVRELFDGTRSERLVEVQTVDYFKSVHR